MLQLLRCALEARSASESLSLSGFDLPRPSTPLQFAPFFPLTSTSTGLKVLYLRPSLQLYGTDGWLSNINDAPFYIVTSLKFSSMIRCKSYKAPLGCGGMKSCITIEQLTTQNHDVSMMSTAPRIHGTKNPRFYESECIFEVVTFNQSTICQFLH